MIVMKITKVAFLHTKHRQQQHQQSLQQQQPVHCSNMLLKTNKVLIAPIASGCGSLVVVVDSNMDCHPTSAAATATTAPATTLAKPSTTTISCPAPASTSAASSSFACNKSHSVIVVAAATVDAQMLRYSDDADDILIRLSNFKQIILMAALPETPPMLHLSVILWVTGWVRQPRQQQVVPHTYQIL